MTDFDVARRMMVDNQLRTINVTDRRLLAALGRVPRERFVPEARQAIAYADTVHPLGGGRALAAPGPLAQLLQLAEVGSGDSVLDVGCGTGYAAAVLGQLAARVTGLEPDAELAASARQVLAELGADNVEVVESALDGSGLEAGAYDVIVLEGSVAAVPAPLLRLLADNGRLVALVRAAGTAPVAHVFVRSGDEVTARMAFNASMPPLQLPAREESFIF